MALYSLNCLEVSDLFFYFIEDILLTKIRFTKTPLDEFLLD